MPVNIAPCPTTRRSALGDRTHSCVNVSFNDNKNADPTILPRKSYKPVLQVKEATTKINILVVQEDENTHQPTKLKRVDVFSDSTWDDVTMKGTGNKNNDECRASLVSVSNCIIYILNGISAIELFNLPTSH